jgi:hypothetical protein
MTHLAEGPPYPTDASIGGSPPEPTITAALPGVKEGSGVSIRVVGVLIEKYEDEHVPELTAA